jgi:outer membrane protein assembly factor BamB
VELFRPATAEAKKIHSKNSLASPTPIVRAGRVYVHFGHMGTAALDLSGKVLWKQTDIKYSPVHGNGGSPTLVGDLLIFGCDGVSNPFLAALDANTGAIRWKTPRNTPARSQFSFCTPLLIEVDAGRELISPASGFVGAYNPADGRELWRVRYGEGYSVVPRPVYAGGLLFLSSGFDRPVIYAINPKGAQGDATDTHVAWTATKGAPTTPSPLVIGDKLYLVSDGGIASCFDAGTGKMHWSERLGGGFSASPVAAEGRIYFQNESGVGYVMKAGTKYELLAKNDLGERSLASPAILDNCIFIRTESHLWRIGK